MRKVAMVASILALAALACSGGDDAVPGDVEETLADDGDAIPAGDGVEAKDPAGDGGEGAIDGAGDLAPEEAGPATCASGLKDWQCLAAAGATCGAGRECDGEGGCDESPCYGLCDTYPGQCLSKMNAVICTADGDCAGTSAACVDRSGTLPGACRTKTFDGACAGDDGCATAGTVCAGALACTPGQACGASGTFGKCVAKAAAGACWRDADCGGTQACSGARVCLPGACTDAAGTCVDAATTGCLTGDDCAASPDGKLCVGATACPAGATCALPDQRGYCAAFGGFGSCWEDSGCGDLVCRGALRCPPGAPCPPSGPHPVWCADPPPDGEGIGFVVAASPVAKQDFPVVVINRGAVDLYVRPCDALRLQSPTLGTGVYPDDPGKQMVSAPFKHPTACGTGATHPLMRIPPGSSYSILARVDYAVSLRAALVYGVGCRQNQPDFACLADRHAFSSEFTVK